jgi:outer membrane protein
MNTSMTLSTFALASSLFALTANANDAVGPGESDSTWIVGGSLTHHNNLYAGEDNDTSAFPVIRYNGDRFFVKDGSLNLHLGKQEAWSYGLTLSPSGSLLSDKDEYKDNARLQGLEEREYTAEGGFYVNHTNEKGRLHFSLRSDLGSEHDGQTAVVNYTWDLRAGEWFINPYVGAEWISSNKADHLFGVNEAESTDTRAAYQASSSFNAFAGVRGRLELTDKWDFNFNSGLVALGDGIKDSSIVDEDHLYFSSVGVNYNF